MTLRRPTAVLTCALLLAVASACGGGSEEKEQADASPEVRSAVEVSGDFGAEPEVTLDAPLTFSTSESWTTSEGDGDTVGNASTAILQLTLVDGRTGKTAVSTASKGQAPIEVALGSQQIFPSVVKALVGQKAGSRVVVASTSDDTYGANGNPQIGIKGGDPVVIVADVLSTDPTDVLDGPDGTAVTPPRNAPKVVEKGGVPVSITMPKGKKPTKLQVITLEKGDGPAIASADRVTVDYLGQVWSPQATKPFDQSYDGDPATFSIGLSRVIKAWDQGLVGVTEGSRVLLVCPPGLAYGNAAQGDDIPAGSTLVFVIDVLGVG